MKVIHGSFLKQFNEWYDENDKDTSYLPFNRTLYARYITVMLNEASTRWKFSEGLMKFYS